jgi:hypothetical protein
MCPIPPVRRGAGFQPSPIYGWIGAHHQEFHSLVGEIVRQWNSGNEAEAAALYEKLMPHTDELFA